MKKSSFIFALMATVISVQAQLDTLNIGDREPTYYYWDTNWWDYYYLNYPEAHSDSCDWLIGFSEVSLKPERARYCYTDTSLRIIGIAAAFEIKVMPEYEDTVTNIFYNLPPEYLSLYEVDSTTDELVMLASKSWNWTNPRYQMVSEEPNETWTYPDTVIIMPPRYAPVYEVYFDSAITVSDSFYVSATMNNYDRHSTRIVAASLSRICAHIYTEIPQPGGANIRFPSQFFPKPNHFRRKLHTMPAYEWEDTRYGVMDTAWHTFNMARYLNPNIPTLEKPLPNPEFLYIFPIIDTSSLNIQPQTCNPPSEFTDISIDGCTVTLHWEADGSSDIYEVALCHLEEDPESGIIVQSDTNFAIINVEPEDTAMQVYSAWVRCLCPDGSWSEWAGNPIFNTHCTSGTERINVIADRYTYLMPNPANETVTVASSFRIAEVELFSLDGRSLLRSKVDAMSTTLNLDGLTAGTYIVRIATNGGTAYKKLVVK